MPQLSSFRFLDLPLEVRLRVYKFIIGSFRNINLKDAVVDMYDGDYWCVGPSDLRSNRMNIMRTSKAIWRETSDFVYTNLTVHAVVDCKCWEIHHTWLRARETPPQTGLQQEAKPFICSYFPFQMIKELSIELFAPWNEDRYTKFKRQLAGVCWFVHYFKLQKVTVSFWDNTYFPRFIQIRYIGRYETQSPIMPN